jgi:hypothetical protein
LFIKVETIISRRLSDFNENTGIRFYDDPLVRMFVLSFVFTGKKGFARNYGQGFLLMEMNFTGRKPAAATYTIKMIYGSNTERFPSAPL